jgi:uncharacterized protein (TIGR02453 family)
VIVERSRAVAFRGFPAEAFEFYEGLEADNSKAYWTDHRAEYEEHVKAPMEELLAELAPKYGEAKIFRPYRDVRFSADKSPYKTNMAAILTEGPYLSLDAHGIGSGVGYYWMASDQLAKFRQAIDDDKSGKKLESLVADARKRKIEVSAHDGPLKTAPKGYSADHPRIELLRMKGLIAWKSWPVSARLGTKAVKTLIVEFLDDAKPLVSWLDKNVGPTTLPVDGRR